jgi:hypothetical protein
MTTSPLMMTVFIRHCETKKGRFIDEMKEPRLLPAGFFNGAGQIQLLRWLKAI